jgi:hypothetical protein
MKEVDEVKEVEERKAGGWAEIRAKGWSGWTDFRL